MKSVIYPGSFDGFTKGHKDILERASTKFEHVIVGVGHNPDKKYMFSFPERVEMIKGSIREGMEKTLNIEVLPYSGLLVDFSFEKGVSTIVRGIRGPSDLDSESMLHWVGESQKLGIDTVFMLAKQEQTHISSSATKAILKEQGLIQDYVTLNVKHFMEARMMGQYIVGLTGTIGAGKSYVTDRFLELGKENNIEIHNIDLDKIGHFILEEATDNGYKNVRQELVNYFGEKIRKEDGFIDRKILGEIVFNDSEKMKKLDEILFNSIILRIRKATSGKKGIILLNGALLVEAGITELSNNNIVLVGVDSDVQYERLSNRGLNSEQIDRRINSQFSSLDKKEKLTKNISSSGYGSILELENNGNNEQDIANLFDETLCKLDIYGELRIKSVLTKLGLEDKWFELYSKVKPLHDDVTRLYHNWFHIVSCFNRLYEIKNELSEDEFIELFLAFMFHDSVYDAMAKKGENEMNSAILAEKILQDLGVKKEIIEKVKSLIMLTISHEVDSKNLVGKYMVDIDLSILGQDFDTYYDYTKSIRHEYSNFSDKDYKAGRLSVLEGFIKKQIYHTPYFSEKYENQAKFNLEKEIIMLMS